MEFRSGPFDVEAVFAKVSQEKKKQSKKSRGPDSPLYNALFPTVNIMRVFGLAPYDFSGDRLVPTNIYLIFSAFFFLFYSYVVYVACWRINDVKRGSSVLGSTEYAKVIFNYLVAVYDFVLTIFTRTTFVKVWNGIQDFDVNVRQLGYPRKETTTTLTTWTLLILNTIIWIAVNRVAMYAFLEYWIYNISYMSIYIGTSISIYKFAGVALILGQRFHQLNDIAVKSMPSKSGYKVSSKITIKTVQSLHNDLMIIGETLASMYSWPLLIWLANLSLHTVSNTYFIIDWLLSSEWKDNAWPLIICQSCWLCAFLVQFLCLHIACDYASSEANEMGRILTDWQMRQFKNLPKNVREFRLMFNIRLSFDIAFIALIVFRCFAYVLKEKIETSLHLMERRLRFTGAGCFDVGLPLLRSIAATMTTYLVILLQLPD